MKKLNDGGPGGRGRVKWDSGTELGREEERVRGIPIFWRLIDCSFGLIGLVPLALSYRIIRVLDESAWGK